MYKPSSDHPIIKMSYNHSSNNATALSREEIRRKKALDQKFKHHQKVAREKQWLADHPEIALARQREKEEEAYRRNQERLARAELEQKLTSAQAKKKASNGFAALLADSSDEEQDNEPVEEPVKEEIKEPAVEKPKQKSLSLYSTKTKFSWADECDSDNEDA